MKREGSEVLRTPTLKHEAPARRIARVEPSQGWGDLVDDLDAIVWEAIPATLRFTYVSAGAERVLGYPIRRWLDEPDFWLGIVRPEDRTAVATSQAQARAGDDHQYDCQVLHRDGRMRWVRNRVRVVRDVDGRVSLLRGLMVDITEMKEAEEVLRSDEGAYRLLSENILDLVSLHAPDGRFLYVSPACREIIGYDPDELVGKHLDAVVHPEDLPELLVALQTVLEGEAPPAVVFRALRKTGELRWCEVKGSRVLPSDDWGEVRIVGVTRDISERRLLQEELGKAQRLEALGRLAGGIAHDFNNLLTVMQGHLDFFRQGSQDRPELREDLDDMEHAVRRAGSLTRQLLTFGRRDLSRPRVLDLVETVAGIEELLSRLIPENIRFECGLPGEPLHVRLDPAQFEQVLVNLVMNARDAMPGGGRLAIELRAHSVEANALELMHGIQPGDYAVVRVSDTGAGMDPTTLARIFEPFFTTKGAERGTGLGLSIVYGVVRQSGGHVSVESSLGEGTAFQIWLPLQDAAEGTRTDGGATESVYAGAGQTVLLVDDEPSVRNLVVSVLERAGYRVIVTGSMEEALAAFLRYEGRIHLLLSHIVLPRGTGLELARRLRHERGDLPVLLMTAHSERGEDAHAAPPDGGIHVVSKPFTAEGLVSAVRHALER